MNMQAKSKLALLIMLIALMLMAGASVFSLAAKRNVKPHQLMILFTGDDLGTNKSCGCHSTGDYGGIPRRANLLKKLRDAGNDILLLDVGDAVNGAGEYADIKARFFAAAFPYLKYDVCGVGEMEARYMKEFGTSTPFTNAITTISANVYDIATSKLLAPATYTIKETKNGLKVGVISVLSEALVDQYMQEKIGIKAKPVREALKQTLPEVRGKSDVVVLLFHGDLKTSRALAMEFPEIDIILDGHPTDPPLDKAEQIGNTILATTKSAGKYVGKIILDISADRKITKSAFESMPVDNTYPDDEEMVKLVAQNDKDLEDYYARMRTQYAQNSTDDRTQPRQPKPFVTVNKCRECHPAEFTAWSKTRHARSYNDLMKDSRASNPECVSCHTTGFKLQGGFTSIAETADLTQVQCEMCHGPGVIHSRRANKNYGAVSMNTCVQCHNRANSPRFDYATYRPKILHKPADPNAKPPSIGH